MLNRLLLLTSLVVAQGARGEDIPVDCPKNPPKTPDVARSDVYKDSPFKGGEEATYEVTWSKLLAGYATLAVRPPIKHNGVWHRVFHIDASTGDWFSGVLTAKEAVEAISRPWDGGISQFYMDQNEGKLFSSPFVQQKWLEFDHDHCVVHERTKVPDKAEEKADHPLVYGAMDSLGVAYNLRGRKFKLGQVERAPVYTSEKNWWLEATPVAFEKLEVPAGTYDTVKLKLKTFIGKDMQQQGDVFAWIAVTTPEKQLVAIQGDVKIGSVWIKLHKYKAGSG